MGLGFWGLGLGFWGQGFGFWGLGLRVLGLGFRVSGARVYGIVIAMLVSLIVIARTLMIVIRGAPGLHVRNGAGPGG